MNKTTGQCKAEPTTHTTQMAGLKECADRTDKAHLERVRAEGELWKARSEMTH